MSEQQQFRDPAIKPTNEMITEGLGSSGGVYARFIEQLQNHDAEVEWRYYNDGKAWLGKGLHKWLTGRGTQKELTVFWLSIWDSFFKVAIYVPEKYRAEVLSLPLNDEVKKMIENAKQIGKLKFFPLVFDLCSEEMFDGIFTLIDFRKTVK